MREAPRDEVARDMALIDFDRLREPISEAAACGPDLDMEGDGDYLNVMARAEGLLPDSFFSFDKSKVDLASEIDALSRLLERSCDLRVLTLVAKLLVLDRNLDAFTSCIRTIAWLLEARWSEVHPADDLTFRSAVLQALDDVPYIILPLQFTPLFESRRTGNITLRNRLLASGEVSPRGSEKVIDFGTIDQAATDCELPKLIATRDTLKDLRDGVASIRSSWIAQAGFDDAPGLEAFTKIAGQMLSFVDDQVGRRDPQAALGTTAPASDAGEASAAPADGLASVVVATSITSKADVIASFASLIAYFNRLEPSNPALLMILQAKDLVGRNIVEAMRIVVPERFEDAKIQVSSEPKVTFPLQRLSELLPVRDESSADDEETSTRVVAIATRQQAVAELEQIAIFYRSMEPSSPIPMLIDRGRAMISLDFRTLLREIMPPQDD